MTKEELLKLDEQLSAREKEIIDQLKSAGAVVNPSVKGDYEPAMPNYGDTYDDSINESTDLDRNVPMINQLEGELEQIRDTRAKIKAGSYGTCSNCGNAIIADRLRALPTAALCMNCSQQEH